MSRPTGMALCLEAQDRLEAAGIADAWRDASVLFLHALQQALGPKVRRHHLAAHLQEPAPPELAAAYEALVAARERRQPVSQITGRRAFWDHDFIVTPDTLDPRPETETLVEAALDLPWNSVLDLGTGTGAILISLLAARPGARGLGCDISPAALDVARRNAHLLGVGAEFRHSDWFGAIDGRFDLIVSNPPYIALAEMADLAPEVRDWEPHSALTDGGDGLSAYRAIAGGFADHLAPGGHVLVEIGQAQGADVQAIFRAAGAETRLLTDLDGRDRVVLAQPCG
ncbi:peptide chain release factor N(5)-glutamine methyltransferase [Paracoccus siganidrum]|nr:peptide chain release factor N(5)-glutamine methyltransferase [Paracoccus siganidrum]